MELTVLPTTYTVWKLPPSAPLPQVPFFAAIRSAEELTLVTEEIHAPTSILCERCWRALKVEGPLEFSLTGVLAALAAPLAEAGIPIFALSTFSTDYLLVKESVVSDAIAVLQAAGHTLQGA